MKIQQPSRSRVVRTKQKCLSVPVELASLLPLELLGQHSAHANAAGICTQDKN